MLYAGTIALEEGGGWVSSVEIPLNSKKPVVVERCQEILNQRSREELSHEVSTTSTRLKATRKALYRVQEELSIAAEIQRSMLLTEREINKLCLGVDVGAMMLPSKEVGGDLYDCIPLGNQRFCLCLGDVSGKGVPASLTMSTCLTLVRSYAETLEAPSKMMERINQRLSHNNEKCTFTTLVIGILDGITGAFQYCNAGHNPTFLIPEVGTVELLRGVHGPPVGAMDGVEYKEEEIQLSPGTVIVMYSDGASEMFAPSRERYGMKRMDEFLRCCPHEGMPRLVREFMYNLKQFGGDEPQHDDITLLATRLLPRPQERPGGNSLRLQVPNRFDGLSTLKAEVDSFSERAHISKSIRRKLQVVLDELVSNIVRYGFKDLSETDPIHLSISRQGHRIIIRLRDSGRPFNPFDVNEPQLDLPLEDRTIGGLGLHLVRSIVASYRYRRLDVWNQVDLEMLT
jgi:sigma-B regulation protein RsbU (phosphoserine phosphatase)